MEYLINAPKPQFTVDIGRMLGEQGTRNFGASMIDMLDHPEKYKPDVPDLVVPRGLKANGKKKREASRERQRPESTPRRSW